MKLNKLKPNFSLMNSEEQISFFSKYREKRQHDLIETTFVKISAKGKRRTEERKITISSEAFELLKKLGLTK